MKNLRFLVAFLFALVGSIHAQGVDTTSPGNIAGTLYASSFANWTVPQGNAGDFMWSYASACTVSSGGITFAAFKVGTPVKIVDANPAMSEVVTPTAVKLNGLGCSIAVSPIYTHYSYYLTTATGGLQEALNWAGSNNYTILLTSDFTRTGGTTPMITAAVGNSNVSIIDQRTGLFVPYLWNGTSYAAQAYSTNQYGSPYSLAYYQIPGTMITPAAPFNGIGFFSANAAPAAATTANLQSQGVIVSHPMTGLQAVSGALNVTDVTNTDVAGFPQQLLGFSGQYDPVVTHDSAAWDANGLGAPSNTVFLNGKYWVGSAGYPTTAMSSQSFGVYSGQRLGSLAPYSGNPIFTSAGATGSCAEGPIFFVDGDPSIATTPVYLLYNYYPSACDSFGTGQIWSTQTTVAAFPAGWSAPVAMITKPSNMEWLYRPFVVKWNGVYYDYSNGGDASGNDIIGYFTAPAMSGPWTYQGTVLTTSQAWEANGELQDPQVWHDPSGLWIMGFGADGTGMAMGFATSSDLVHWTQLASNPSPVATTPLMYLPKFTRDAEGQYWMMSAPNNGAGLWLSKAVGPPGNFSTMESNGLPLSPTNPAYTHGADYNGSWDIWGQWFGSQFSTPVPLFKLNMYGEVLGTANSGSSEFLASVGTAGSITVFEGTDSNSVTHSVSIGASETRSGIGTISNDDLAFFAGNGVDLFALSHTTGNASVTYNLNAGMGIIGTQVATFTPGTNISTVTCVSGFVCSQLKGSLYVTSTGTAAGEAIVTLHFPTGFVTDAVCSFTDMSGMSNADFAQASPYSSTGATIYYSAALPAATYQLGYSCQ